jgi:membrane-bound lytic murein transglycosylase MltF
MRIFTAAILLVSAFVVVFKAKLCMACDWIERCEPYRAQVESILKSESVSPDFFYLMAAESRCTQKAVSEKGAAGFWQLMPSTAKHYGCSNLHDLECATRAAARYIRHLQTSFRRFEDIIIAYNMGGHNYRSHGATREARGLVWMVKRGMKCE